MAAPAPPTLPDLNSGPRNFITTDQDHGGIALVICTLMATWVVLCFFVRMYMRATVSGPFGVDDVVCSIATIFGVIQMIVSTIAISYGFGKNLDLLTESQIEKVSKAVYVAELLYIVTNALTKATVALLLARIVFIKSRVRACYGVLIVSLLWGFASFIAEAVKCTRTAPWRLVGPPCGDLYLSWEVITAFNILIEIALLAFPVWLVWGLQTDFGRKFTVVSMFWLRSPVIVAAGLRLHFLSKSIGSEQPFFNGVIPFTLLNIEMHYGLMAATMPTLRPFVGAFNTGWGTYDTQGVSGYGQNSNSSYVLQSLGRNSNRKGSVPMIGAQTGSVDKDKPDGRLNYGKNVTHVRSGRQTDQDRLHSGGSGSSQQMIIRQTVETEIRYEQDESMQKEIASSPGVRSLEDDSVRFRAKVQGRDRPLFPDSAVKL